MVRIEPISPSRPDLANLFVEANDGPYPLERVIREKLDRPGVDGPPDILGAFDDGGLLAGAAVRCGRFLRLITVTREDRRQGTGTVLLNQLERRASLSGQSAVVVAAEPGNYFLPGTWTGDSGTIAFFQSRGYSQIAQAVNLRAELGAVDDSGAEVPPDRDIRRAQMAERERVCDYIHGTFGRIWSFEAEFAFDHEVPTMFIAEKDGEIVGFSAHLANNAGLPWYGPTGVSRSARGQGLGRGLLLASLRDMRSRGFTEAIIAWAAALEFYARACGASPAERFMILEKRL